MTYLDVQQELRYTARTLLEFQFRAENGIRDFYISDIVLVSFNIKDNDARK